MDSGALGAVQIQSNFKYNYLWSVEDDLKKSAITCVQAFDLTKDGKNEIIVGRDDGRLEVYTQENVMSTPKLSFSKNVGESVRSTDCGLVNSDSFNEIVVAAYSGKIIGYTSEPVLQRAQEDTYGRSVKTVNNENRIKYLKKELESLKKNVDKEREKLRKSAPTSNLSNNVPSAQNDFPINTRFLLDSNLAAYVLTIEIQSAMDLVIIRSPVALDLVESGILLFNNIIIINMKCYLLSLYLIII
jgi:Bardet-Biedl syndrome 7 protein